MQVYCFNHAAEIWWKGVLTFSGQPVFQSIIDKYVKPNPDITEVIESPGRLGWRGSLSLLRRLWRRYDLALVTQRLSQDWLEAYGHPIAAAESFVDSQLFRGTAYAASNWQLLGQTDGFKRVSQDFYTRHDRPTAVEEGPLSRCSRSVVLRSLTRTVARL